MPELDPELVAQFEAAVAPYPDPEPSEELREQVRVKIGSAYAVERVARTIINPATGRLFRPDELILFKRIFAEEIDVGEDYANMEVANSVFKIATKGENEAAKLKAATTWLQHRDSSRWKKQPDRVEHTGLNGEAIEHRLSVVAQNLDNLLKKKQGTTKADDKRSFRGGADAVTRQNARASRG